MSRNNIEIQNPKNILALCCALDRTYIALQKQDRIENKTIESTKDNYHSLFAIEVIKELFDKNKIQFKDLDLIAVNLGPGSFTGVRVALTIAKVIAGEFNIPIAGVNTAEIMITKYNCDLFLADARRDMYYLGDKNEIKLVLKDKIKDLIKDKSIVCDRRCLENTDIAGFAKNVVCYENDKLENDLGGVILKLAKEKYAAAADKTLFDYRRIKANYIQTPPIFGR